MNNRRIFDELLKKERMKENFYIIAGLLLVAGAIHFFFLPNSLSLGGATGLATILGKFTPLRPSTWIFIVNAILFVIGFKFLGRNYGIRSVISAMGLSLILWIFEFVFPITQPLVTDLWIQLLAGTIFYGIGIGIVVNNYASTGGTDIIAMILNNIFGLELGSAMRFIDIIIISIAGLVFGLEVFLYSFAGVFINSLIINTTIDGFNRSKLCIINTREIDKITKLLLSLERSANIYEVTGAYSGEKRKVIQTVMTNQDFVKVKRLLQEVDPNAFMIVSNASETYGLNWMNIDR